MSSARLVLLDIDGTLLHGGKLWKECFARSFFACCDRIRGARDAAFCMPRISFSGKTDKQICRELLEAAGFAPPGAGHGTHPEFDRHIDSIIQGYLALARERVPTRAHEVLVLPGAHVLVAELARHADVTLGLLTGNMREGAFLKLRSVGLDQGYVTGVFGDDHWDRYELPAIAVARARTQLGREFAGKQVVIIGDTIHDIGCGQKIGARAIGVGTGHAESRARVHGAWKGTSAGDPRPDHYFEDLSDTVAVLAAVFK